MMRWGRLRKRAYHVVVSLFIINDFVANDDDLKFVVVMVDAAGSHNNNNNDAQRFTSYGCRLFRRDHNDMTTIMRSDSSLQSTVLLRNQNSDDDSALYGRRLSKLLVHDDDIDDDDDDLIQRLGNRNKNRGELSSSRSPKPLDLSWRCEPSDIIIDDDNYATNEETTRGYQTTLTKTGTTIVGVSGHDYCILGADSRATSSTMVADKYCDKLHPLARNCAAAGAGTSADLDHITRECYHQVQLWLSTSSISSSSSSFCLQTVGNRPATLNTTSSITMIPQVSVQQICRYLQQRLYEQRGTCQANLIVGGIDVDANGGAGRGILRAIHPHGSMDVLSYTALGSGSYAAMGVLESAIHNNTSSNGRSIANDGYTPHNLTIDEAIALVVKAVKAGIDHDLGSGSQVDLCIITSDGIANYTRCYVPEERYDNSDYSTTTMNTEHISASTRNSRKSRSYQTIGINGFGNVPYVVRSKRALQQPGDSKALVEGWNDILPK